MQIKKSKLTSLYLSVEILSVKKEKEGNTFKLKNNAGEILTGVISIPNLDPSSTFDFKELKVGNHIIISGKIWMMGDQPRITIFKATSTSIPKGDKKSK